MYKPILVLITLAALWGGAAVAEAQPHGAGLCDAQYGHRTMRGPYQQIDAAELRLPPGLEGRLVCE